ncbi:hypothetical protein R5W24_005233 [Gemmata sp. JC717]|uniref:hypothetical protein n=1 Tax=Gemmata algarum TaxID=2975278 RepID=UPI0021BB9AAF|nr:hypothetical protein [Gemmata algarum]MDY3556070.1 hypothetical protein [Gemmata algarum]
MRTLLFALGTAALVGCHAIKPVGPLADHLPAPKPAAPKTDPTPPPAVKPTPPSLPTALVTPGDVTDATAREAASKLTNELTADSKPSTNAPVTVSVSRVKGGIK